MVFDFLPDVDAFYLQWLKEPLKIDRHIVGSAA